MCGITALFGKQTNIFPDLFEALYHLQHRGQDSYGYLFLNQRLRLRFKDNQLSSFLREFIAITLSFKNYSFYNYLNLQ